MHIVVLTGAGISADSGLATFRGAGGLWEGHRVEEVATPQAWRDAPTLVWRFYQMRRAALLDAEPNEAHRALGRIARDLERIGARFTLITQNVDNLHERSGSWPLHMHGELMVLRCEHCHHREPDLDHLDPSEFVPCNECGFPRLRPDVVWFGEMPYHLERIEGEVRNCTHFLALGTSGVVWPAAGYLGLARECGARTIVNALERPENLHAVDEIRLGRASEVVPELCAELLREASRSQA